MLQNKFKHGWSGLQLLDLFMVYERYFNWISIKTRQLPAIQYLWHGNTRSISYRLHLHYLKLWLFIIENILYSFEFNFIIIIISFHIGRVRLLILSKKISISFYESNAHKLRWQKNDFYYEILENWRKRTSIYYLQFYI